MSVTLPNQAAAAAADREAIRPFNVEVSEEELIDLRRRVSATKWPDRETDPSQGVRLATIQAGGLPLSELAATICSSCS